MSSPGAVPEKKEAADDLFASDDDDDFLSDKVPEEKAAVVVELNELEEVEPEVEPTPEPALKPAAEPVVEPPVVTVEEPEVEESVVEPAGDKDALFDMEDKEDLAGIEDDKEDLFGDDTPTQETPTQDRQPDLFDEEEDEEEGHLQGAIPVRSNSDHDRVPFNTPAVGCALDDTKTTALLNAAKESAQQNLKKSIGWVNGDKKSKDSACIEISSYTRIGEGYNSYIVYTIQTTLGDAPKTTVQRRFNDFFVLHQLIVENYLPRGVIVPPVPEKNFMGTAKVRFGGNNDNTQDQSLFIKRRKAALERYLNRLMAHHLISKDETLRRFLQEEDAPRPNPNASGIKGFMKNMETMVTKATARINEVDEWYEDKQGHILEMEETLKKILAVVDNIVADRRDLVAKSAAFGASCLHLGEGEDNASLRRAITKLSELENNLSAVHSEMADSDLFIFGETVKDYISIIQAAKAAFDERVKTFSVWESSQSTLAKKREAKNKATLQGKADRVAQCDEDIRFWEGKVEKCQEDFEVISKNLKEEIRIFEEIWVRDIKESTISYFQKLIDCENQIVGHWKEFLPEAKIIN